MVIVFVVCLAVLATSFISGIFGMAGGIILMAVLSVMLPLREAFVVHGASQFLSNASRSWIYKDKIIWSVVSFYMIGWLLALLAFYALTYIPSKGVVFIVLGLLPWIGFSLPKRMQPDIRKPLMAVVCGVLVTSSQMLAGASGPMLDYFYLTTNMSRYEIVGTKAFTQSAGHLAKFFYYGIIASTLIEEDLSFPLWWLVGLLPFVWTGTQFGRVHLDRLSDKHFRYIAGWLTRGLGILMVFNGIFELMK